jgi:hypothetical protein
MLDLELGLQWNWEGVLNWVAVSFFEASTKTSVGSSDSQRISCVSKSAAGIVVDGAHTNSRHWNCGPWCPPLGSRPLCKQPLHLFPSSLLPPLEENQFCKLLSSSCKNAHKDQVILEFWILECHKDLLVILEFFKVYLCNVVKMRWFLEFFLCEYFQVVLDNGIVQMTLTKPEGIITCLSYGGIKNVFETRNKETNRG